MLLVLFLALSAGCATVRKEMPGRVNHVVICWLKEQGNKEQSAAIIEVSKTFADIPGVLDVRVGNVIESDRKIVDDSYDVAITLSFGSVEDMKAYLVHPTHEKAKKEVLLPIVRKIVVYDFME